MRRKPWFEIHDQPWFPGFLRDLVTEALEGVWNGSRTYHPAAGRLREALRQSGAERIVDLCSGGGGPWPGLYHAISDDGELQVWLTDRYPNTRTASAIAEKMDGLTVHEEPVDARRVPPEMHGFRTIFSSFHHFDPAQARAILSDAFKRREGIAILEAAQCSLRTMACVAAVPFLAVKNAWMARPLRLSRLFWTSIVPVVPAILWLDGILSCLRSYSRQDLQELIEGLTAPDYEWQIGEERAGRVPITCLMGTPLRRPVAIRVADRVAAVSHKG